MCVAEKEKRSADKKVSNFLIWFRLPSYLSQWKRGKDRRQMKCFVFQDDNISLSSDLSEVM
jgi:hypothetical protein